MYEIVASGKTLELGGGTRKLGDINMDARALPSVDLVHDLGCLPWPFANEEFETAIGIYCLEHIAWPSFDGVIDEIKRILKPGGKGYFLVPNTFAQAQRMIREGINKDTIECLFGSNDYPENTHRMGFSEEYAKELFEKHGFSIKTLVPMPDVYFKGQPLYPGSKTDMVIEITKPGKTEYEAARDGTTRTSGQPVGISGEFHVMPGSMSPDQNISGLHVGVKSMIKDCLNLGSFCVFIKDGWVGDEWEHWINIDVIDEDQTRGKAIREGYNFEYGDISKGIVKDSDTIDRINMSHLLEHFTAPEGITLLKDCLRALRPGGTIRVCVPDTAILINAYLQNDMERFDKIQPEDYKPCSQSEKLWRMITSNPPELMGTPQWEGHKTAYDWQSLFAALGTAGFIDSKKVAFETKYDTFPELSLVVTAMKPKDDFIPPHPVVQGAVNYQVVIPATDPSIKVTDNKRW